MFYESYKTNVLAINFNFLAIPCSHRKHSSPSVRIRQLYHNKEWQSLPHLLTKLGLTAHSPELLGVWLWCFAEELAALDAAALIFLTDAAVRWNLLPFPST